MFINKKASLVLFAVFGLFIFNLKTFAQEGDYRGWYRALYPSTGFNSDCAAPLFQLPAPMPADAHFDFIGLFNEFAPESGDLRDALKLSSIDCEINGSEFVATTSNDIFLELNGLPFPDPRLRNLKTNEIPKVFSPDGARTNLPPHGLTPAPLPPTSSIPNSPMTLDEFRSVRGYMALRCYEDGTAKLKIRMRNYRPNELLTVWAIWLTTPPGAAAPIPVPVPLGGVPNVIVPNESGRAVFSRSLSYCPMDVQPDGSQLMLIDIATHLDGSVYGGAPDTPFAEITVVPNPADPSSAYTSPMSAGIVTLNRGAIPVRAR